MCVEATKEANSQADFRVRNCRISHLKHRSPECYSYSGSAVALGSSTEDLSMRNKLVGYVAAGTLALALASPALAFHGGGGGHGMGGGMGGGGWGGMHSMGAMSHPMGGGTGPHWSGGIGPHWSGGGWHRANFSQFAFRDGFHHGFFHHRFNRFAFFFGAPYYDYGDAYYDDCWRRVRTHYGLQVVNVCGDYGY
jgi:hypothetical protein